MADSAAPGATPSAEAAPAETAKTEVTKVDATYFCLDVSGSIRDSKFYSEWVAADLVKAVASVEAGAPTRWVLWGSSSMTMDCLDAVVAYLAGDDTLGGTSPSCFVGELPQSGTIDLHVYTDGEIGEYDVEESRKALAEVHGDLKIRRIVVNYVNESLNSMNVGLSAIFDGHVLDMHRTRVAESDKKVHEFNAVPLASSVTAQEIVGTHLSLGKTEEEMTQGVHYLGQRFANADKRTRQEIRRIVREAGEAVKLEYRTKILTGEQEKDLLANLDSRQWHAVRKPFIGHAVPDGVKLLQEYTQKFLNETKLGGLIRVSAYAPLKIKSKNSTKEFDELEDVLLDHIMYLGLGKEAVIVLPVGLPEVEPAQPKGRRRVARQTNTHVQCGLNFKAKINFDNTFGLETLFQLREQQAEDGVGDAETQEDALELLSRRAQGEPAANAEPLALASGACAFGVNPFTRQQMECMLLVPADADALPADRLAEVDAWNAHMMSRFVRAGRTMPSVALLLALVLERAFRAWDVDALAREEDRATARRLMAVCRKYLARMRTPLTFGVGLPVIIEGTFATAARIACGVLQGALDPSLPLDVLTQFWYTITTADEAEKVWTALAPYAGLEGVAFPKEHHVTLRAVVEGAQLVKSARDPKLREKKGLAYSARAYSKRLDQLARGGCDATRLRAEEKAARKDLFGVAESEPLLCVHGVDADKCAALPDQRPDTLCLVTCRPTLLNPQTMDMWYVGQPHEPSELALQSFHKAMWQLVRKRNKGKTGRHSSFPPGEALFKDFVNHRLRAVDLQLGMNGDKLRNILPTVPCARLAQDIELTYASYVDLLRQRPNMNRKKFMKALREPREVCAFEPCCEFIRKAVSEEQLAWIDTHATHKQVASDAAVLSGKETYRGL